MSRGLAERHEDRRAPTVAQQLVIGQLLRSRTRLETVVRDLHERRDRQRWTPGAWSSLNEVLEHLILVEGSLERFVSGRWASHAKAGQLPVCRQPTEMGVGWSGLNLAPSVVEYAPTGLVAFPVLWRHAHEVRERLLGALRHSYGLAWSHALITRPGFGGVRATLHQWLLWTGEYEMSTPSRWRHVGVH